jgi:lipoyl-dependent peroxiredoxin subunit D
MDSAFLDRLELAYRGPDSAAARDLRLNLKRLLGEGALETEDALLVLLAAARSVEAKALEELATCELSRLGLADEAIQEAAQSAAVMAMLNTYYRFRHMIGDNADYVSTGLRMNALAKPVLGKKRYELLSFAISVLNGCETCIKSHEKFLREAGVEPNQIHDAARLAAVTRGYKLLDSQ